MKCPVCGSGSLNHFASIKTYHLVKCTICSLIYCDNPQSSLETEKFYQHMYNQGEKYICYGTPDVQRHEEFHDRLEHISQFQPEGRLLDIGCSTGEFLEMVSQKRRYVIDGIDLSSEAVHLASARLKRNIFCGMVDDIPAEPASYDVVTAWEVIEHTSDPGKFLRSIWRLLKPGGLLCLSTPNTNKIRNRIHGKPRDLFFIPPEHLFYFNGNNLRRLTTSSGFRPLLIDVSSKRFLRWFSQHHKLMRRVIHAGLGIMSGIGIEGYSVVAYGRKVSGGA